MEIEMRRKSRVCRRRSAPPPRVTGTFLLVAFVVCSCDLSRPRKEETGAGPSGDAAAPSGRPKVDVPEDLVRVVRKEKPAERAPRRRVPKRIEVPAEIRVKIYWANAKGQVIYSPERPFPEDWSGVTVPLSIAGAHIEVKVNQMKFGVGPGPEPVLDELARILAELAERNPTIPVVIDARRAVPFKWVFGALDACKRAKVKSIRFQAPPVRGGGGSDWWWM